MINEFKKWVRDLVKKECERILTSEIALINSELNKKETELMIKCDRLDENLTGRMKKAQEKVDLLFSKNELHNERVSKHNDLIEGYLKNFNIIMERFNERSD